MIRTPFLLLSSCFAMTTMAQGYGNVWQFGNNVGLDFNTSICIPAVITNGQNEGFEGCASVCDAAGELLFYTNSATIWNASNAPMPNGQINPGSTSLSQVLIVGVPGSSTLYVVVTTTLQGSGTGQLEYHVVDMSLAGGSGDVLSDNNQLYAGTSTEHVAATRHANGTDIWVMAHDYPSNTFLAYLLTGSGTFDPPVISNSGPAFAPCGSNINARGEMKFSVDGQRLAIAGNGIGNGTGPSADSTNVLALFHFDNATGIVSDPVELPFGRGDFGLSFSPDGSKLYGATWKAFNFMSSDSNVIYQFDLASGINDTIIASQQILLSSSGTFGSLKLGPDGRIYVARSAAGYLGVIHSPDQPAPDCDYQNDGVYLNGATCRFGLNNYIEYNGCGTIALGTEEIEPNSFSVFPNPATTAITLQGRLPEGTALVNITDATGRIVHRYAVRPNVPVGISDLSPGPYLLGLCDREGRSLRSVRFIRTP